MNRNGKSGALSLKVWLMLCIAIVCEPALGSEAAHNYAVLDVRCVVVALRMAEMAEPQRRVAGTMLALYYLGRLDGRVPDNELEGLIERETGKMTEAEFRANAVRCGKALALKGQEIQKIGAELSSKAAK